MMLATLAAVLLNLDAGGAPLTVADAEKLGAVATEWKEHGTARQAYGVPLSKVLEKMGFITGEKKDKLPGYRKLLVATGTDGYKAVFTAAELIGGTQAFLVWKIDGKPLPKEQGEFRLVVTTDKEGARCVYQLAKLELTELPK